MLTSMLSDQASKNQTVKTDLVVPKIGFGRHTSVEKKRPMVG